jgi:hypothetical protein
VHEGIEALIGLFLPLVGEVEVEHGGFELGMAQITLDETRVHAGFEQMGRVRMPQGMDSDAYFGEPGPLFGFAEGALDAAPTHGSGRGRALVVIAPGGGKEPGGVTVGFPIGTEQREGMGGHGDVPVLGALTAMDMDLEALAVNIRDLKVKGFMESEAQAIDGGEVDLVVQGCRRGEEPLNLLHTEDSGETMGGLRTHE